MSDTDRNRAVERLGSALAEGRLTMGEYDERLSGVLAARTFGDLTPYFTDIPGDQLFAPAPEFLEIRSTASSLKRQGSWVVPRRLLATARAASVRLNFTDAVIVEPTVEIELDVRAGSTTLVLPRGASADVDQVAIVAGSARARGVPNARGAGPHFIVRGHQVAGSLVVRYERRFLRWRW